MPGKLFRECSGSLLKKPSFHRQKGDCRVDALYNPGVDTRTPLSEPQLARRTSDFPDPDFYVNGDFTITYMTAVLTGWFQATNDSNSNSEGLSLY